MRLTTTRLQLPNPRRWRDLTTPAAAALAVFFLLVTCGAAIVLRTLSRRSPGLLGLAAQEWEKDRRLLTELLEPRSAETL